MLINKFIDELKPEINNLSEIEKARYVYIKLGKIKEFNDDFLYGTSLSKSEIYNNEKNKQSLLINDLMQSNKLICVGLSKLYKEILNRLKISCELCTVGEEDCRHMYNIIKTSNDETYKADLQKDMRYIHIGMSTHYFGQADMEDLDIISKKDLKEIDKKIGYIKEDYTDKYIQDLLKQRENETVKQTVTRALTDEKFNEIISNLGYVEAISLTRRLLIGYVNYEILPINSIINIMHCYDSQKKLTDSQDSLCIYIKDAYPNEAIFLYKKRARKFVEITQQELIKLKKLGIKIVNSDQYKNHRIKNEILKRQEKIQFSENNNNNVDEIETGYR